MANFDADEVMGAAPFASGADRSDVGAETYVTTYSLVEGTPGSAAARLVAYVEAVFRRRYYKLRAPCSSSPSGYVTWINTTGGEDGRPPCAGDTGPAQLIASWVQTHGGR